MGGKEKVPGLSTSAGLGLFVWSLFSSCLYGFPQKYSGFLPQPNPNSGPRHAGLKLNVPIGVNETMNASAL